MPSTRDAENPAHNPTQSFGKLHNYDPHKQQPLLSMLKSNTAYERRSCLVPNPIYFSHWGRDFT